jgi:hypothetical protein
LRRFVLYYSILLLFAAGGISTRANVTPPGALGVRNDVAQQVEPKKREITASISRSIENETISLTVSFPDDITGVRVALYNILGKLIEIDPTSSVTKGDFTFVFRTTGLPSGPYLVILEAGGQRITKKIMLSR